MAVDYGSFMLSIVILVFVNIVGRGHVTDSVNPTLLVRGLVIVLPDFKRRSTGHLVHIFSEDSPDDDAIVPEMP